MKPPRGKRVAGLVAMGAVLAVGAASLLFRGRIAEDFWLYCLESGPDGATIPAIEHLGQCGTERSLLHVWRRKIYGGMVSTTEPVCLASHRSVKRIESRIGRERIIPEYLRGLQQEESILTPWQKIILARDILLMTAPLSWFKNQQYGAIRDKLVTTRPELDWRLSETARKSAIDALLQGMASDDEECRVLATTSFDGFSSSATEIVARLEQAEQDLCKRIQECAAEVLRKMRVRNP